MVDGVAVASEQPLGPVQPGPVRPRVTRTRACLIVAAALMASGLPMGALWAWAAPPIHAVVAISSKGARVHEYLGAESQNFFVAPFLLLGLLSAVAVVAAVAVWQWRDHRGPQMAVALTLGLVGAVAVAAGVGALLVLLRYGALDFDTVALSSGDHSITYVQQAPPVFFGRGPLQVLAVLLAPGATGSLVYAFLAAGTARDDLGGYPRIDPPSYVVVPVSPVP